MNGSLEESGKGAQRRLHRANGQKFVSTCVALLLTQLFSFPSSASPLECELGDEAASEIAITISLFGNGEFEKSFESIHESIRVLPEDSAETISRLKEIAPAGFQSCDLISRVELKPSYIKDVFAFSTNDSCLLYTSRCV